MLPFKPVNNAIHDNLIPSNSFHYTRAMFVPKDEQQKILMRKPSVQELLMKHKLLRIALAQGAVQLQNE